MEEPSRPVPPCCLDLAWCIPFDAHVTLTSKQSQVLSCFVLARQSCAGMCRTIQRRCKAKDSLQDWGLVLLWLRRNGTRRVRNGMGNHRTALLGRSRWPTLITAAALSVVYAGQVQVQPSQGHSARSDANQQAAVVAAAALGQALAPLQLVVAGIHALGVVAPGAASVGLKSAFWRRADGAPAQLAETGRVKRHTTPSCTTLTRSPVAVGKLFKSSIASIVDVAAVNTDVSLGSGRTSRDSLGQRAGSPCSAGQGGLHLHRRSRL